MSLDRVSEQPFDALLDQLAGGGDKLTSSILLELVAKP